MKKYLSLFAVIAVALVSGIFFTACNKNKNKETSMYITFDYSSAQGIEFSMNSTNSNTNNKHNEYDLKTTYGTYIDLDYFDINYNDGDNSKTLENNDTGYNLVSNLPTEKSEQVVGNYTLTYTYSDWTNVINVTINKKVVSTPSYNFTKNLEYTGTKLTINFENFEEEFVNLDKIVNSKSEVVTNNIVYAGNYIATFSLKDKVNTVWGIYYYGETEPTETADQTVNFTVDKKPIIIDRNEIINTSNPTYNSAAGNFHFTYDGTPKECDINTNSIDTNLIDVVYMEGSTYNVHTGDKINTGIYTLYFVLKDTAEIRNNYILVLKDNNYGEDYIKRISECIIHKSAINVTLLNETIIMYEDETSLTPSSVISNWNEIKDLVDIIDGGSVRVYETYGLVTLHIKDSKLNNYYWSEDREDLLYSNPKVVRFNINRIPRES